MYISQTFWRYVTFKINGVSNDTIRLRLFPFTLRDKVKSWLKLGGSIILGKHLQKSFWEDIFRLVELLSLGMRSYHSNKHLKRVYMKPRKGGKSFSGNVHIMASTVGYKCKPSIMELV